MFKSNRIFIFITISVVIIVLDFFHLLNFIKNPIDRFIIPVKKEIFQSTSGFKSIYSVVVNFKQLLKLYEGKDNLSQKNEELQLKLRLLETENAKLRIQLEAPFPSSYKFVPAQVITIARFMEIEAGSQQGIKKGQLVVDGTTLVGVVETVSANRSNVKLVTDPDFQIAAVTSRGTSGVITGQGEQNIILTKVLQKDPLFLDDQVVTMGVEFVPPNLLIGKITNITQEETATYKQAKIAPLIDQAREKIVFVINSL